MVKSPPAIAGDAGSIRGSGRSSGEGNGNSLHYSCLENSMDRGAWGCKESDMTEQPTLLFSLFPNIEATIFNKFSWLFGIYFYTLARGLYGYLLAFGCILSIVHFLTNPQIIIFSCLSLSCSLLLPQIYTRHTHKTHTHTQTFPTFLI